MKHDVLFTLTPGTGMGHGATSIGTVQVSPAVLQTVMSMIPGGGRGTSGTSTGAGTSGSLMTVNPPVTSGPSVVTTTVACSQCAVNPANPGHILCQKCFQLAS